MQWSSSAIAMEVEACYNYGFPPADRGRHQPPPPPPYGHGPLPHTAGICSLVSDSFPPFQLISSPISCWSILASSRERKKNPTSLIPEFGSFRFFFSHTLLPFYFIFYVTSSYCCFGKHWSGCSALLCLEDVPSGFSSACYIHSVSSDATRFSIRRNK